MKENIVLIGMPGAGKSTVGVVLAKRLGLSFLDSDLVIQEREGCILHEIIEKEGLELLGWRKVPTEPDILGHKALECMERKLCSICMKSVRFFI